jgi:brefeldin A-resistance guanine nucleotide exchange factor 1
MRGENSRQKKSKKTKDNNSHILQKNLSTSLSQTVLKPEGEKTTEAASPAKGEASENDKTPSTSVVVTYLDSDKPSLANSESSQTAAAAAQDGLYLAEPRKKTLSESSSSSTKTNDANNSSLEANSEIAENVEASSVLAPDTVSLGDPENINASTTEAEKTLTSVGSDQDQDYVNPRGVRFIQDGPNAANVPYGLPCLRELLRFLISLINAKNSEIMISMGLNLITIGLESGVDHIAAYQSLLTYVKDDLARNLFNLLTTERLPVYASVLRVLFLLFESLRTHLKYQLEFIFTKLMNIIQSDSNKLQQDQREMTIDFLLQMLRIPGFAIEMYINYDCSLNCTNLFEDLTKLLSKNAFSVQSLLTANSLSLSALLTIVENIELENTVKQSISNDRLSFLQNTLNNIKSSPSSGYSAAAFSSMVKNRMSSSTSSVVAGDLTASNTVNRKISSMFKSSETSAPGSNMLRVNRMKITTDKLPTHDQLRAVRIRKRIMQQSVDLFNQNPAKSIQFLKDNSIFSSEPNTQMHQLIAYLKDTPALDKKVMGDYLSSRKNLNILDEFVKSFDFANMRIDESLRLFLETFRLPGEAPLISNVMEHFARHWRKSNNNAFANDDAAFTLAYAIIMLNVDQHNHNVKKQSTPMIVEEFKKNVSKVNGGGNFDEKLLEEIYTAIKSEEIVMPAEHTGALRDNYLWKILIRRDRKIDTASSVCYIHAPAGSYNQEIFNIVWGQTISALSFVYDKSFELAVIQKTINGFK